MAEVLDKGQVQVPCGEMHAYLDHDAVDLPLSVRCRQPGDRFQPLGMGHTRVSDFMINEKIPQRARSDLAAGVQRGADYLGGRGKAVRTGKNKRRYRKGNSPVSSEMTGMYRIISGQVRIRPVHQIPASWRNFMLTSRH